MTYGVETTMTSLAESAPALGAQRIAHTKYRPDIDGLRALAVIPVILFHAGIGLFGGGYIGVDVFFVISGYLITSIIISEKKSGTFKVSSFYKRRAKRILPVLLFVIATAIPVAWAVLPPKELAYFSQSIISTLAFCSNILFWLQSGYFDTTAELKPLLHTWSLAVEEQYYIVFPLLIMCLWRSGERTIVATLSIMLFLSLVFSVWFIGKDQVGSFYLLPARAWEILTGAMLALLAFKTTNRALDNAASLAGILLILVPVFTYTSTTALTALYAVPPVIGASLIIQFSKPGTMAYRLLTLRPMLWVGLLSYSAYLWHQPLLAFAKIRLSHDLSPAVITTLIAATFILSVFSFWLIENPSRKTKGLKSKAVIGAAVSGALILAGAGYIGNKKEGFPGRAESFYSADAQDLEKILEDRFTIDSQDSELYRHLPEPKQTIMIVGDSYVKNWSIGINENIDHSKYRVIAVSFLNCDIIVKGSVVTATANSQAYEQSCSEFLRRITDESTLKTVSKIFLVSHRPFEYFANNFRFNVLNYLRKATGAQAYIFGNYYQLDDQKYGTCMNAMFANFQGPDVCLGLSTYPQGKQLTTSASVPEDLNYTFVDIIDLMCEYEKNKCPAGKDGVPFMEDWNHLTASFIKFMLPEMKRNNPTAFSELGLSDVIQ